MAQIGSSGNYFRFPRNPGVSAEQYRKRSLGHARRGDLATHFAVFGLECQGLRRYHYRLLDRADLERSVHGNLGVRGNADAGYGEGLKALLCSPPLRTYRRGRRKGIRADRGGLSLTGLTGAGADNSHPRLRHRSACLVGDGAPAQEMAVRAV